jgi:threonine/homoserine/homoserine lactone efflux protein
VPHLFAAITGLAALLHASALAFDTLRLVGVAYLLYMAWATVRDRGTLALGDTAPVSSARVVGSAVLVNLLNPKLTIFFFAFLPQFVHPGEPQASLRMLELSAVFMFITFAVFSIYGVLAAALRERVLARPSVLAWLRRVFGASFVALAGKLAFTDR